MSEKNEPHWGEDLAFTIVIVMLPILIISIRYSLFVEQAAEIEKRMDQEYSISGTISSINTNKLNGPQTFNSNGLKITIDKKHSTEFIFEDGRSITLLGIPKEEVIFGSNATIYYAPYDLFKRIEYERDG